MPRTLRHEDYGDTSATPAAHHRRMVPLPRSAGPGRFWRWRLTKLDAVDCPE